MFTSIDDSRCSQSRSTVSRRPSPPSPALAAGSTGVQYLGEPQVDRRELAAQVEHRAFGCARALFSCVRQTEISSSRRRSRSVGGFRGQGLQRLRVAALRLRADGPARCRPRDTPAASIGAGVPASDASPTADAQASVVAAPSQPRVRHEARGPCRRCHVLGRRRFAADLLDPSSVRSVGQGPSVHASVAVPAARPRARARRRPACRTPLRAPALRLQPRPQSCGRDPDSRRPIAHRSGAIDAEEDCPARSDRNSRRNKATWPSISAGCGDADRAVGRWGPRGGHSERRRARRTSGLKARPGPQRNQRRRPEVVWISKRRVRRGPRRCAGAATPAAPAAARSRTRRPAARRTRFLPALCHQKCSTPSTATG